MLLRTCLTNNVIKISLFLPLLDLKIIIIPLLLLSLFSVSLPSTLCPSLPLSTFVNLCGRLFFTPSRHMWLSTNTKIYYFSVYVLLGILCYGKHKNFCVSRLYVSIRMYIHVSTYNFRRHPECMVRLLSHDTPPITFNLHWRFHRSHLLKGK